MTLKTHGRYHYSPISGRPHYEWPGGKRLAFYVVPGQLQPCGWLESKYPLSH